MKWKWWKTPYTEDKMKQTSRNWLIDAVEYIWQLLAYTSHMQEIIDWYWENEDITIEDFQFAVQEVQVATRQRREMMQVIMQVFEWNDKYRCAVKHSIFAYTLSTEILYSDMNNKVFAEAQKTSSERMYKTISKFIWTEIVTCGRCLSDQIEKK